jgi:hypothetical protein
MLSLLATSVSRIIQNRRLPVLHGLLEQRFFLYSDLMFLMEIEFLSPPVGVYSKMLLQGLGKLLSGFSMEKGITAGHKSLAYLTHSSTAFWLQGCLQAGMSTPRTAIAVTAV